MRGQFIGLDRTLEKGLNAVFSEANRYFRKRLLCFKNERRLLVISDKQTRFRNPLLIPSFVINFRRLLYRFLARPNTCQRFRQLIRQLIRQLVQLVGNGLVKTEVRNYG